MELMSSNEIDFEEIEDHSDEEEDEEFWDRAIAKLSVIGPVPIVEIPEDDTKPDVFFDD